MGKKALVKSIGKAAVRTIMAVFLLLLVFIVVMTAAHQILKTMERSYDFQNKSGRS